MSFAATNPFSDGASSAGHHTDAHFTVDDDTSAAVGLVARDSENGGSLRDSAFLEPPNNRQLFAPFAGPETPRDSLISPSPRLVDDSANNSAFLLSENEKQPEESSAGLPGGNDDKEMTGVGPRSRRRRRRLWIAVLVALIVIAVAVAVPVGVVIGGKKTSENATGGSGGGGGGSGGGGGGSGKPGATTGGDGSIVTAEDGTTFTYVNKFGGFWVDDPKDPFNNNAQPNSWTPPLNTSWTWGVDRVYG